MRLALILLFILVVGMAPVNAMQSNERRRCARSFVDVVRDNAAASFIGATIAVSTVVLLFVATHKSARDKVHGWFKKGRSQQVELQERNYRREIRDSITCRLARPIGHLEFLAQIESQQEVYFPIARMLDLSHCGIERIDRGVIDDIKRKYPDIQALNLSYNPLCALPENLNELKNLQTLLIEHTLLDVLPDIGTNHEMYQRFIKLDVSATPVLYGDDWGEKYAGLETITEEIEFVHNLI